MKKKKLKKIASGTLIAIFSLVIGYTIWIPNKKADASASPFAVFIENDAGGYNTIIIKRFSEIADNYATPTIDCGSDTENAKWTWNATTKTFSATGLTTTKNCRVYFNQKPYSFKIGTITVDDVSMSEFPTEATYTVNPNCTGATATWNYASWSLDISAISSTKASCSPEFTSVTNPSESFTDANNDAVGKYLGAYIKSKSNETGTNGIFTENTSEYRYEGEDPNNYIQFNDELWRIIGAFDNQPVYDDNNVQLATNGTQTLTKIIRNESIGSYAYNKNNINWWAQTENGTTTGSNLNNMLNKYYINALDGTDDENADCMFYSTTVPRKCDYRKIGIKPIYKNMVANTLWYLGGFGSAGNVSTVYSSERGNTVYNSDNITRDKTWIGKVGLMYPSDYGYSIKRSDCERTTNLSAYNTTTCGGKSWMLQNGYEWTISPRSSNAVYVWNVPSNGDVSNVSANSGYAVRPVLNLSSSVYIVSGDGSLSNPYIINGE